MLRLYSVWHLNLAYSSIEEEQHKEVLERCYRPLLQLASERGIPLGIEAPAWTLTRIGDLDPTWLDDLRQLMDQGMVEFIGSGWSQIIGPLVPGEVVVQNLRLGWQAYRRLLGIAPRLALINEQAWSPSLLPLYRQASAEAVIMEWENPASIHPEWPRAWRYHPQLAQGSGVELPVIWNHSIAFQKFQRLAHGEIALEEWIDWVLGHDSAGEDRALCIYGNDAETFNFRPGRYGTEAGIADDEWRIVGEALQQLAICGARHVLPASLLQSPPVPHAWQPVRLESPAQPVPTKKQPKYNVIRWACGGRDAPLANTWCERIYRGMLIRPETVTDEDWQTLCELWASDVRTHLTEHRWKRWRSRAQREMARWPLPAKTTAAQEAAGTSGCRIGRNGRFLDIDAAGVRLRLNLRRGLTIDQLAFAELGPQWLIGTLHHGQLDDIAWSADFYTWETVLELPGSPKVTDLEACEPAIFESDGRLMITGEIPTPLGPVLKSVTVHCGIKPAVELELTLRWQEIPPGSLRMGDLLFNPDAFDRQNLLLTTHLGGLQPKTFHLAEAQTDHGRAWSALISAQQCLGVTEGWIEVGDSERRLRIEVDRTSQAIPALLTLADTPDAYVFRLQFSGRELDDTSGPHPIRLDSFGRTYRFRIEPVRQN
ncbi:MAG: glycoside hydrolase family 57 [Methylococcaceae bacterium]|nr:glycoside hydrolase family 57 [Methylococcaceae bacterium]